MDRRLVGSGFYEFLGDFPWNICSRNIWISMEIFLAVPGGPGYVAHAFGWSEGKKFMRRVRAPGECFFQRFLSDKRIGRTVRLYVGNVPFTTNEGELREAFEQYGAVESATIITDRHTGRSRGFGFVEMTDPEEARKAMEALNESMMGGRPIVVNEARQRQDRGGYNKRW